MLEFLDGYWLFEDTLIAIGTFGYAVMSSNSELTVAGWNLGLGFYNLLIEY